jgi:flotillin
MDIRDAKNSVVIKNIMEKKKSHIEMESRQEVAKNVKMAEIAEIDARREVELQREQARQITGLRKTEAEQAVALAQETSLQVVAEKKKVTKEKELEVASVELVKTAEIKRQVEVVNANKQKETSVIAAQGELESQKIAAEQEKQTSIIRATGELESKKLQATAELEVAKGKAQATIELKSAEAKGIDLEGTAKANAQKALLMAPVTAQTALAKEIGSNKEYQQYLLTVEKIKATRDVGVEQAKALTTADIKVIATGGNASDGLSSAMDLFSAKGGVQAGAMLEGLATSDIGKAIVEKVTGKPATQ